MKEVLLVIGLTCYATYLVASRFYQNKNKCNHFGTLTISYTNKLDNGEVVAGFIEGCTRFGCIHSRKLGKEEIEKYTLRGIEWIKENEGMGFDFPIEAIVSVGYYDYPNKERYKDKQEVMAH